MEPGRALITWSASLMRHSIWLWDMWEEGRELLGETFVTFFFFLPVLGCPLAFRQLTYLWHWEAFSPKVPNTSLVMFIDSCHVFHLEWPLLYSQPYRHVQTLLRLLGSKQLLLLSLNPFLVLLNRVIIPSPLFSQCDICTSFMVLTITILWSSLSLCLLCSVL